MLLLLLLLLRLPLAAVVAVPAASKRREMGYIDLQSVAVLHATKRR